MPKPRVLVTILTGIERHHWINPDLVTTLIAMSHDQRFDTVIVQVKDHRPFDYARNVTIATARDHKFDWLISFDNDIAPQGNPLDIIASAGDKAVIGVPYGVYVAPQTFGMCPSVRPGAGEFQKEDIVAGGVLMVHSAIWKAIPKGPWFRWAPADDELLSSNGGNGEDVFFCKLAREHGFQVWSHRSLAAHYRTANLTGIVTAVTQLEQRAQLQSRPTSPPSQWLRAAR